MVGVAVQGHAGTKTAGYVRLLPKAGECLAQRSSLDHGIGQRIVLLTACQKDMNIRLRLEHFPANLFFNRVVINPVREGATVKSCCREQGLPRRLPKVRLGTCLRTRLLGTPSLGTPSKTRRHWDRRSWTSFGIRPRCCCGGGIGRRRRS